MSRARKYESRRLKVRDVRDPSGYRGRPRYVPTVNDGASRFELFAIPAAVLEVPVDRERPAAIARARTLAQAAGYAVLDVVRADYQDGGEWRVELVVVEA
jgi:hypothetical protein